MEPVSESNKGTVDVQVVSDPRRNVSTSRNENASTLWEEENEVALPRLKDHDSFEMLLDALDIDSSLSSSKNK